MIAPKSLVDGADCKSEVEGGTTIARPFLIIGETTIQAALNHAIRSNYMNIHQADRSTVERRGHFDCGMTLTGTLG